MADDFDRSSLDCGVVYVATGAKYYAEAVASAASLRRQHPGLRICLLTDRVLGEPFWDDLLLIEAPAFSFEDKLQMSRSPYGRSVFLDTDTTVVGSLAPIFRVLERYDVCGVQYAEGQDYTMDEGIPAAFAEMNGGMIGFRRGPATEEFFGLWKTCYRKYFEQDDPAARRYENLGDQKSLRAALWLSSVRHCAIGAEFNFIPFKLELASLPVAVFHTRQTAGLDDLERRLNRHLGRRVYIHTTDTVVHGSPEATEWRGLLRAALAQGLRRLGRAMLPRAVRDLARGHGALSRWLFGGRYEPRKGKSGGS